MYDVACVWGEFFAVGEDLVRCGGKVSPLRKLWALSDITLTLTLSSGKTLGQRWYHMKTPGRKSAEDSGPSNRQKLQISTFGNR